MMVSFLPCSPLDYNSGITLCWYGHYCVILSELLLAWWFLEGVWAPHAAEKRSEKKKTDNVRFSSSESASSEEDEQTSEEDEDSELLSRKTPSRVVSSQSSRGKSGSKNSSHSSQMRSRQKSTLNSGDFQGKSGKGGSEVASSNLDSDLNSKAMKQIYGSQIGARAQVPENGSGTGESEVVASEKSNLGPRSPDSARLASRQKSTLNSGDFRGKFGSGKGGSDVSSTLNSGDFKGKFGSGKGGSEVSSTLNSGDFRGKFGSGKGGSEVSSTLNSGDFRGKFGSGKGESEVSLQPDSDLNSKAMKQIYGSQIGARAQVPESDASSRSRSPKPSSS